MPPTQIKMIRHYHVQLHSKEAGWCQPIRIRADTLREGRHTEFLIGDDVVAKIENHTVIAWWVVDQPEDVGR